MRPRCSARFTSPAPVSRRPLTVPSGSRSAAGTRATTPRVSAARPDQASRTFSTPEGSGSGAHGTGAVGSLSGSTSSRNAEQLGAGHAVDHAVVDLRDQRPAPVLEPFDEPGLPQRPAAVELLAHQAGHQVPEGLIVARRRERGVTEVVVEVEVGVVDPHRASELERDRRDPLPVARDAVQLRRQQLAQLSRGRLRPFEDREPRDVHVGDPVLEVEELGIEHAETLHGSTVRVGSWREQGPRTTGACQVAGVRASSNASATRCAHTA